jgi:hypothetical protein
MRLSNGSRGRPARGCRVEGGGELGAYTEAVVLTYLRLSRCKVGLLINFNVAMLKDGIRRSGCELASFKDLTQTEPRGNPECTQI